MNDILSKCDQIRSFLQIWSFAEKIHNGVATKLKEHPVSGAQPEIF